MKNFPQSHFRATRGYVGKPSRQWSVNGLAFVITLIMAAMICAAAWAGVLALSGEGLREIMRVLP